ncbi:S41 family peptidase [Mucilaginibacter sp. RS28]|uniref:S41 family peptidase n=1 Tax=Mucilaginibacter straminoryzae TaxID=2932774 RepID=A0A9X1X8V9_9SPHI|nr:S41 family peptidase [Mucilaginibacter straminoryzae]MCJ8210544.1 S41 family peptidase [Mucilaginibacter straminoryzae]
MKLSALTFVFLFAAIIAHSQSNSVQKKYSKDQLKEDIGYLKNQIYQVHAYPFTELDKSKYDELFQSMQSQLRDSMSAAGFAKVVKPAIAYLSDEHANIGVSKLELMDWNKQAVYIPFSLYQKGTRYHIAKLIAPQSGLKENEEIISINGIPVEKLIEKTSLCTTGFKDQRKEKALTLLGLYAVWAMPASEQYDILLTSGQHLTVSGIPREQWETELNRLNGTGSACKDLLTYQKVGSVGYLKSCSFSVSDAKLDSVEKQIDAIFKQIKQDRVTSLVIDVSQNGGGNSSVGNMIIDHFNKKPYKSYQCNWKRSDDYLALLKQYHLNDQFYASQPIGKIIHFDSETASPPANDSTRFNRKVYVVVGDGTFSSAIMFATVIKDNQLAKLVGKAPRNGHPNHFGELYQTRLPYSGLVLRFGVKEWIRPNGKDVENRLTPDIAVNLSQDATPEKMIHALNLR